MFFMISVDLGFDFPDFDGLESIHDVILLILVILSRSEHIELQELHMAV